MDQSVSNDRLPNGSARGEEGDDEDGQETNEESNDEDGSELEKEIDDKDDPELEEERDDESLSRMAELPFHDSLTRLCSHCQYMLDNWYKASYQLAYTFPHYDCLLELRKSAAYGCPICLQFVRSGEIQATAQELEHETIAFSGVHGWRRSNDQYDMIIDITGGLILHLILYNVNTFDDRAHTFGEKLSWQRDEGHADVPVGLGHSDREEKEAQTSSALTIASRWLRACRNSHGQCKVPPGEFTPTRLISTAADQARLCEGEDISRRNVPEYATLSHCWGNYAFHTLQSNSLESFKNRIPQEALSQTVSDSIKIARDLGFSYIWIDTLCILQDDDRDWMRESSLMSSVYGGSSLNIAASGAVDGNSGCFLQQSRTWGCMVKANVREKPNRFRCVPLAMYHDPPTQSPLAKRGWALQERLLPPRSLHFTATQLVWECHTKVACESFPEEFPNSLIQTMWKKRPVTYLLWPFIVETYSLCNLSYSKDKLVAISGLARIIQDQTGDEYVAGMWRKNLEFQLCWVSSGEGRRIVPYEAPTWSWASLEHGEIFCDDLGNEEPTEKAFTPWISISDIRLQRLGHDPLGQLAMANLCISCSYLLHVTIVRESEKMCQMIIANRNITNYVWSYDCADVLPLHNVQYLLMPAFEGPIRDGNRKTHIRGLILQPTGQEQGQYYRLGMFFIYSNDNGKLFKEAAKDPSCHAKDSDCYRISRDEDGNPRYIINLI